MPPTAKNGYININFQGQDQKVINLGFISRVYLPMYFVERLANVNFSNWQSQTDNTDSV